MLFEIITENNMAYLRGGQRRWPKGHAVIYLDQREHADNVS